MFKILGVILMSSLISTTALAEGEIKLPFPDKVGKKNTHACHQYAQINKGLFNQRS